MKDVLKYIPYALILLAFIAGRITSPDNSKEVEARYKAERKMLMEGIIQKQTVISEMETTEKELKDRMRADSAKFAHTLKVNERVYSDLKRKYNEINLSRADAHTLDSLVAVLFSE